MIWMDDWMDGCSDVIFFFLFTKQGLKQKFPREFVDPEILALLEFDWHAFLDNQKKVF